MSRKTRITGCETAIDGIAISVVLFESDENQVVNSKFSSVVLNKRINHIENIRLN
jgi:hypothetical protein